MAPFYWSLLGLVVFAPELALFGGVCYVAGMAITAKK